LAPLARTFGSEEMKYGATENIVIHPGVTHDITAIKIEINPHQGITQIHNLKVEYQIAAEGVNLIGGQKMISKEEIWSAYLEQV
jgi:hypothetical protein